MVARPLISGANTKLLALGFACPDFRFQDLGMPERLVLHIGLEALGVDLVALALQISKSLHVDLKYADVCDSVYELAVLNDRTHSVLILKTRFLHGDRNGDGRIEPELLGVLVNVVRKLVCELTINPRF